MTNMASKAFQPFKLPNGSTLKNRIVKAAMEENLADVKNGNSPSKELFELYRRWGEGGAGLILSGHIMIDPLALAGPGDVVLAADSFSQDEKKWRTLIDSAQRNGSQFWLQLNHPGRQTKAGSGLPVYAPSPIPVDVGKFSSMFAKPIEMTEGQILDVIERFKWAAKESERLGASGVAIHAAHGYLISQFLSPLSNRRSDSWGGSLENRAKLLFKVLSGIKSVVSSSFGLAIKVNTSDFQRGGFDANDLNWLIKRLNTFGLDFVELSGGSYEMPAMSGAAAKPVSKTSRTLAREAYFIQAANEIKDIAEMPLLVTGGISNLPTVERVMNISDNTLAGVATAFGLCPDIAHRWERGEDPLIELATPWMLPHLLIFGARIASVQWNLHRLGKGHEPWQGVWPTFALLMAAWTDIQQMSQYKTLIHASKA